MLTLDARLLALVRTRLRRPPLCAVCGARMESREGAIALGDGGVAHSGCWRRAAGSPRARQRLRTLCVALAEQLEREADGGR